MKILVVNLGSTSLKYRLFELGRGEEVVVARGAFERLADHREAIGACLEELRAKGALTDPAELAAVGF